MGTPEEINVWRFILAVLSGLPLPLASIILVALWKTKTWHGASVDRVNLALGSLVGILFGSGAAWGHYLRAKEPVVGPGIVTFLAIVLFSFILARIIYQVLDKDRLGEPGA